LAKFYRFNGVSVRLDTEPGLFFKLRKVEIKDLVSETMQSKSQELLDRAKKKSSRVMEDSDLSAIFGIRLDESPPGAGSPNAPAVSPSPIDMVVGIIRESKDGVDATQLKYNTNLDIKEIRGIISRLKREGKIKNLARGVYIIA
jgi:hypothetical protein